MHHTGTDTRQIFVVKCILWALLSTGLRNLIPVAGPISIRSAISKSDDLQEMYTLDSVRFDVVCNPPAKIIHIGMSEITHLKIGQCMKASVESP